MAAQTQPRGVNLSMGGGSKASLLATGYSLTGLDETLRDLNAISANGKDMGPLHKSVALDVRGMQQRHFQLQEDSTGAKWKALSGLTVALRGGERGPILRNTGMLMASVNVQSTSATGWQVGTRKIQAAVQQYGATILPKHGKYLFIPLNMRGKGKGARSFGSASREYEYTTKSGKRKRSYSKGKGRELRKTRSGRDAVAMLALTKAVVPAREFLYLNTRERGEMVELYVSELSARGTTYIKWQGLRRAAA